MKDWTRSDVLGLALGLLVAGWVTMVALATPVPPSDLPTYLALARDGVWDVDLWTDAAGARFVNATLGYQRLCWGLFLVGGWPLVVALHGLSVGAALFGAVGLGWQRGRGRGAAVAGVLAASLVLQNHAARPQTVAFALGVVAVGLFLRPSRSRWAPLAWWALLAVWANVHGSFLVGLALAGCGVLRPGARRAGLLALGAALVGSLCTPWGDALFVYAWENSSRPAARGLAEWGRPGLDAVGLRLWPALAALGWWGLRARPPAWQVLPVLGLAALACTGVRHAAWVGLVAGPIAAGWLPARASAPAPSGWRWGLGGAVGLVVVGLLRFLPGVAGPPSPGRLGDAWLEGDAPVEALEALGRMVRPSRICAPFAQGGLVRWRLGPGWTVPVDVRVWLADDGGWQAYLETRQEATDCVLLIDRVREPHLEQQTQGWREPHRDERWSVRVPRDHPGWVKD